MKALGANVRYGRYGASRKSLARSAENLVRVGKSSSSAQFATILREFRCTAEDSWRKQALPNPIWNRAAQPDYVQHGDITPITCRSLGVRMTVELL